MTTTNVSPLEAIDLVYASPWPEDPELRALLALLARHFPSIWPSRERIALGVGLRDVGSVSRRLRRLEDDGLITSITLGARANQRTFRILHLPGLPLVIPPELEGHAKADELLRIDAMADADSQRSGAPSRFELARRYRIHGVASARLHDSMEWRLGLDGVAQLRHTEEQ